MLYCFSWRGKGERLKWWDDEERAMKERSGGGRSAVHPALLHDGRHPLLVLPLVFLVELCGLAVGWAVGIWLIQQRLGGKKKVTFNEHWCWRLHLCLLFGGSPGWRWVWMTRRMSGSSGSEGCLNIYFHLHKLEETHVGINIGASTEKRRETPTVSEQAAPRACGGLGPCSRVNRQCSGANNPASLKTPSSGDLWVFPRHLELSPLLLCNTKESTHGRQNRRL